jgi:soluble lytic murein transglycosylase
MDLQIIKKLSFLIVLAIAAALGISAIGFKISNYSMIYEFTTLDHIESDIIEMENAVQVTHDRETTIKRIMDLIDEYNESMPASQKYSIANEIYEMDVKYDNLNVNLICATITHESAVTWDPHVVSDKGAMGLMQIMPTTGRFLAQYEGIKWTTPSEILFDPITNIRMGSRYLSALIEIYGVEGGLAAYNGGEKRAAMWLANNKAPGILWRETQNYVPAVMRLYNMYRD